MNGRVHKVPGAKLQRWIMKRREEWKGPEIGLRMALGAERAKVIWMALREVFLMAAAGLAIGLPVMFATNKFIQSFLFQMTPNDPWAITGAAFALVLVAVMAGYGPALRASKIDPWNALRHE